MPDHDWQPFDLSSSSLQAGALEDGGDHGLGKTGYTPAEQALLEPVALKLMEALLRNHFARRKPGRPRRGSEVPRLSRGFRSMLRASQSHLERQEQEMLFRHLLNRSLF